MYVARKQARNGCVGESPSWLRHRILIPACEGSNPSSPAIKYKPPHTNDAAAFGFSEQFSFRISFLTFDIANR
jgi:hypothetical protein